MISFAIAEAAEDFGRGARVRRRAVAEILPGEGVRLEGGELIRADGRRVATPIRSVRSDLIARRRRARRRIRTRLEAWQIRSPVVKFNAALDRLPDLHRRRAASNGRTSP